MTSAEEQTCVMELTMEEGYAWLGGSDRSSEGIWIWETGPEAGEVFFERPGCPNLFHISDSFSAGDSTISAGHTFSLWEHPPGCNKCNASLACLGPHACTALHYNPLPPNAHGISCFLHTYTGVLQTGHTYTLTFEARNIGSQCRQYGFRGDAELMVTKLACPDFIITQYNGAGMTLAECQMICAKTCGGSDDCSFDLSRKPCTHFTFFNSGSCRLYSGGVENCPPEVRWETSTQPSATYSMPGQPCENNCTPAPFALVDIPPESDWQTYTVTFTVPDDAVPNMDFGLISSPGCQPSSGTVCPVLTRPTFFSYIVYIVHRCHTGLSLGPQ